MAFLILCLLKGKRWFCELDVHVGLFGNGRHLFAFALARDGIPDACPSQG